MTNTSSSSLRYFHIIRKEKCRKEVEVSISKIKYRATGKLEMGNLSLF